MCSSGMAVACESDSSNDASSKPVDGHLVIGMKIHTDQCRFNRGMAEKVVLS